MWPSMGRRRCRLAALISGSTATALRALVSHAQAAFARDRLSLLAVIGYSPAIIIYPLPLYRKQQAEHAILLLAGTFRGERRRRPLPWVLLCRACHLWKQLTNCRSRWLKNNYARWERLRTLMGCDGSGSTTRTIFHSSTTLRACGIRKWSTCCAI